jgi:hypothetical protein
MTIHEVICLLTGIAVSGMLGWASWEAILERKRTKSRRP